MTRQQKIILGTFCCMFAGLFGLLAIVMLAATGLKGIPKTVLGATVTPDPVKLATAVFGKKDTAYAFSFPNLLPHLLVLAGVAVTALVMFGKLPKTVALIATALFAAAGILFFFAINMLRFTDDAMKVYTALGKTKAEATKKLIEGVKETYKLGAGAYLAGVFSLLSAACTALVPLLLQRRK